MTLLRILTLFIAILGFVIHVNTANAEKIVRVVGYTFPPFVSNDGTDGLTMEFLKFLNSRQSDYRFQFFKAPPKRRYWTIENQQADIILFEMPEWGWQKYAQLIDQTRVLLHGGEVYITQVLKGRNQAYFDRISDKNLVGVFGYHYGFAGFNNDQDWLDKNFSIVLTENPEDVITMILKDRADIGVVSQSYLSRYLTKNPQAAKELLVSEKKDQEYRLKALIGKHAPISKADFEAMLEKLERSGELDAFFRSQGIKG